MELVVAHMVNTFNYFHAHCTDYGTGVGLEGSADKP